MVTIIQKGHSTLEQVASPVSLSDIGTKKLQKIIKDLGTAMHKEDDSVAIAAPQINIPLRIFIVSGPFYEGTYDENLPREENVRNTQDVVFINPEIIKRSKKTIWSEEGCLSVRPWYGDVKRATNVTIRAYNEKGEVFTRGAGGLLAQIFQHEIDHLEGILFDSQAKNLRTIQDYGEEN